MRRKTECNSAKTHPAVLFTKHTYSRHTRILRNYVDVPQNYKGSAVAIGNFDGVHLGHLEVIKAADRQAGLIGGKQAILTFEPHPRQHFAPKAPPFRLMTAISKLHQLASTDAQVVFELKFGKDLAGMTAEEFSKRVLADGLGIACAVVGEDFCFGKGRAGTVDDLRRHGAEYGFGVQVVPIAGDAGLRWSSTSIRTALTEGRTGDAKHMLGRWHRVEGNVIAGERRGRKLGYPTANVSLNGLHLPRFGVYSVLVNVRTGPHAGNYKGAASIGARPTFGSNAANLEVFIFDFSADIYGETISVALVEFQRPEVAFASAESLIAQMKIDCEQSRKILETHA